MAGIYIVTIRMEMLDNDDEVEIVTQSRDLDWAVQRAHERASAVARESREQRNRLLKAAE